MHKIAAALLARLPWRNRPYTGTRHSRRGSIAIIVAVSALPLVTAVGVGIDMSRMAAARSALQRATDNAALSGAAAYIVYTEGDTFNLIARTMATSAFCNAVTALPAGFTLVATTGSTACVNTQGAAVSAVIAGYRAGTRGTIANSGCSATNTVVAGVTCGFIVTVSTAATVNTVFPFLLGGLATVSVTASAINPFINLANAINPIFSGYAYNANSLWVYPLLLDANGAPDFTTNAGALPDTSTCTGNPTQTSCGSYTMLASTRYLYNCPASSPCNDNGTYFVNGVVQNPVVSNAVITATTPLGIALQSAAGADVSYGYYNTSTKPQPSDGNGCTWAPALSYNTVPQEFDINGYPLELDSSNNWAVPTHWLYSSFLANNEPPDYNEVVLQQNTTINPATNYSYATQIIPAVLPLNTTFNPSAVKSPFGCASPSSSSNAEHTVTTYPTTGSTNCAVYIVKDATSQQPNSSYAGNNVCWTPAGTPGYQYAALSCQNYAGHTYTFFWNDMSGGAPDNTNYGDGTLQISCAGASYVVLMN